MRTCSRRMLLRLNRRIESSYNHVVIPVLSFQFIPTRILDYSVGTDQIDCANRRNVWIRLSRYFRRLIAKNVIFLVFPTLKFNVHVDVCHGVASQESAPAHAKLVEKAAF